MLWVEAKSVAQVLGFRSASDMLKMVRPSEIRGKSLQMKHGLQMHRFLNEEGLYTAIFNSVREEAKEFTRWVTHTVLPEIRRTGSFANLGDVTDAPQTIEGIIKSALRAREDGGYVCGMMKGVFKIADWEKNSFLTPTDRTIFDLIYLLIARACDNLESAAILQHVPPSARELKAVNMLSMMAPMLWLPGLDDIVTRCVLLHSYTGKETKSLKTRRRFRMVNATRSAKKEPESVVRLKQAGYIKPDGKNGYIIDHEKLIGFKVEVSKLTESLESVAKIVGPAMADTTVELAAEKRRIVDRSRQAIKKFQFGNVTVVTFEDRGILWASAESIAAAIGHSNHSAMTAIIDKDDVRYECLPTEGGAQSIKFISESGLYRIALKTSLPGAEPFRKWVTGTVLPEIRKSGRFNKGARHASLIDGPKDLMMQAQLLMEGREDDLYIASKIDGVISVMRWNGNGFISPRVQPVAAMSIIQASEVMLMYGTAGVLKYLPQDSELLDKIFRNDIPLAKIVTAVMGDLLNRTVLPSGRVGKELLQKLYYEPLDAPDNENENDNENESEEQTSGTSEGEEVRHTSPDPADPQGDKAGNAEPGADKNGQSNPDIGPAL